MSKIEIIFQKPEEVVMNTLDIYQVQIINLYNKAINIPKIRQMIYFLCCDTGYISGIKRQGNSFSVHLDGPTVQSDYQELIILFVKKILHAYHKRKIIKLAPFGQWWKVYATFDCGSLSHEERGLLTKILKQENKRLARIGVKNRRQKRRYQRSIFLKGWDIRQNKSKS